MLYRPQNMLFCPAGHFPNQCSDAPFIRPGAASAGGPSHDLRRRAPGCYFHGRVPGGSSCFLNGTALKSTWGPGGGNAVFVSGATAEIGKSTVCQTASTV